MDFETKTCGRCGGCGRYSFNQVDGSMCYGCGGSGRQYTKRGLKAREMYLASIQHDISEVREGWLLWDDRKWVTVLAIEADRLNAGYIDLKCEGLTYGSRPGMKMSAPCVPSAEFLREAKAKAIEYQATLKGDRK